MCEKDKNIDKVSNDEERVFRDGLGNTFNGTFEINTAEKHVYNLESAKAKPYDMELMTGKSGSTSNNNENGDD